MRRFLASISLNLRVAVLAVFSTLFVLLMPIEVFKASVLRRLLTVDKLIIGMTVAWIA